MGCCKKRGFYNLLTLWGPLRESIFLEEKQEFKEPFGLYPVNSVAECASLFPHNLTFIYFAESQQAYLADYFVKMLHNRNSEVFKLEGFGSGKWCRTLFFSWEFKTYSAANSQICFQQNPEVCTTAEELSQVLLQFKIILRKS